MKKKKEIKLPTEFNPATQKYEPILPLKKSKKKLTFNWIKFMLIILVIIIIGVLAYLFLQ